MFPLSSPKYAPDISAKYMKSLTKVSVGRVTSFTEGSKKNMYRKLLYITYVFLKNSYPCAIFTHFIFTQYRAVFQGEKWLNPRKTMFSSKLKFYFFLSIRAKNSLFYS